MAKLGNNQPKSSGNLGSNLDVFAARCTAIRDFIMQKFEEVRSWWMEIWPKLKEAFMNIWNAISAFITPIINAIVTLFKWAWPLIESIIVSVWRT
ncbi:hypothetical protein [Bacillus amyloliquefaciens]|uniref:hypothetical protein n=1 Tax=Bacillus amyloliquefaciens TaxID=1390 RepID=UPI000DE29AEC|nr:hypothetical protein [Bacillus amyloliquefaciens]